MSMRRTFYGILRKGEDNETGMIDNGNGWRHPHAARVLCPDGAYRVVRLGQQADTYFSWPARGRATANGRTVRGYVGVDTSGRVPVLRFYPYTAAYR